MQSASVELGRALRRLRGRISQARIADALGITQATVSRWESDTEPEIPSPDQIMRIEETLGLSRGAIYIAAGLVEVTPFEAALLADPNIDNASRAILLDGYRGVVARGIQGWDT